MLAGLDAEGGAVHDFRAKPFEESPEAMTASQSLTGHTFVSCRAGVFGSQEYVESAVNPRLPAKVKTLQICL